MGWFKISVCTDYMFRTPSIVPMDRTGTTDSVLKDVSFNPAVVDFITIGVNNCTETVYVYYDDGHFEDKVCTIKLQ